MSTAFRVLLDSSFSGTNPLAGQTVFVIRKPIDDVLRELGLAVPASSTAAQVMKTLQRQCHSTQVCSSIIQGMSRSYVTTKLDAAGKAMLCARNAAGTYYFFAVPNSGSSLVWDISANLADPKVGNGFFKLGTYDRSGISYVWSQTATWRTVFVGSSMGMSPSDAKMRPQCLCQVNHSKVQSALPCSTTSNRLNCRTSCSRKWLAFLGREEFSRGLKACKAVSRD